MKRVLSIAPLAITLLASLASAQTVSVSPTPVTLSAMVGSTTAASATVSVTSTSGTVAYTIVNNFSTSWLSVGPAGATSPTNPATEFVQQSTPSSFVVFANPNGMPAGTYNATLQITPQTTTGASTIPITFVISSIGISPPSPINFTYSVGSGSQPGTTLQVLGSTTTYTTALLQNSSNCGWLFVSPSGAVPGSLLISTNPSALIQLSPNSYSCSFTITPANGSPAITVVVNLTVSASPTVSLSPSTIFLNFQTGTAIYPAQLLTLTSNSSSALSYTVNAIATDSGVSNWITLSKSSGTLTPPGNTDTVNVQYNSAVPLPPGTYHGQVTVTVNNTQQNVPVQLLVSSSPLLNVAPSTVSFTSELNGSSPAAATVQATATSGAPAISTSVATTTGGNWLFAQVGATTASGTPITITANTSGLTAGTYKGTVSVFGSTTANNPQTVGVTLTIANDALLSTNVSTSQPVVFAYQTGSTAASPSQNISVSSTTGAALSYTAAFTNTTGGGGCVNWVTLSGTTSGATNGVFTATANPSGISAPPSGAACFGTITITATNPTTGNPVPNAQPGSPYTIPLSFFVSPNALLAITPASAPAFSAQVGQANSVVAQNCTASGQANCTLTLTNTSTSDPLTVVTTVATSDNTGWLFAGTTSSTIQAGGSTTLLISLAFVPSTAGSYNGSVTITTTAQSGKAVLDSPLVIPVTLQVTAGTLTPSQTSLSFTQTAGGPAPATQTITVGSSSGAGLNFTASATSSTTTPWLTVSPTSGTTPTTLTITANGSGLSPATTPYTGQITLTAPGATPVTVNVTLAVNGGTIAATPTTLTFQQAQGGSAPTAQTINVTGTPGTLNFTVATATTSGGNNWLTATPGTGTTPGSISVTASAGSLTTGTYNGSVTITSAGATGSPITVPVTLTVVTAQTITVNPSTLTFTAITGQASPSAQTASVSSSGSGASFTATATAANSGTWLTVSPTSGVTPAQLTVSVASQSLAAGNYTGTIAINSPNASAPVTLTVNLTVATIPTPVVAAVKNAASYAVGGVAPGENIVIGGTGIGPSTLTGLAVNPNGTIATTVAGTQILFDGIAAPIIYVSATQSSVMVPYEIAGRVTTNLTVVYQGVSSVPVPYNVLSVQPGIYTQNASGTGPGSILNQNFSVNGPAVPAAIGSVVAVYMTGEGVTSPPSTTGGVAPSNGTGLNKPVQAVTATVGGIPATVNYYGSAPAEIYGVMQVNLTIPAGVTAGAQPVVISVGNAQTQTGVTVTVSSTGTAEPEQ